MTTSMIYSPSKAEDVRFRVEMLDMASKCLKDYQETGNPNFKNLAKQFGEISNSIRERIVNHDYQREDETYYILLATGGHTVRSNEQKNL